MRRALERLNGQRLEFVATFAQFGTTRGARGNGQLTALLKNVKTANGAHVAQHIWIDATPFMCLALERGDAVQFSAQVCSYLKISFGRYVKPRGTDYGLSPPTRVCKLNF